MKWIALLATTLAITLSACKEPVELAMEKNRSGDANGYLVVIDAGHQQKGNSGKSR